MVSFKETKVCGVKNIVILNFTKLSTEQNEHLEVFLPQFWSILLVSILSKTILHPSFKLKMFHFQLGKLMSIEYISKVTFDKQNCLALEE